MTKLGQQLLDLLGTTNNFLWGYLIIAVLILCALYFTVRSGCVQFRMLGEMMKLLTESGTVHKTDGEERKHISSFQAFTVALASRVGTGNLAGVASAIFVGGPGAVFWMWVMALLGAATAFVESTLAQLYKLKGKDSFIGGPAYYMQIGLRKRWMGVLFAILITMTFGMANQVVQSNTICDSLADTFSWNKFLIGAVMTVVTLFIIFGGIQRVSKFSAVVVPFMAVGYIILALFIVAINITELPHVFKIIIGSAFGMQQAAGGMVGAAMMQGIKRGLFSNEAGEGSAPNAAATADISHPVKQGLLQSLGVFTDTLVICTCTAFIIILSGLYTGADDGIILTTKALESEIGTVGRYFISAAVFLFAYSTIIGNYYYGETNVRFITSRKGALLGYRIICGITVLVGGIVTLQTAWSMVDLCMGLMTLCNLIAIVFLSNRAFRLLKNYRDQKKAGKNPEFHRDMLPEWKDEIPCWE